MNTKHEYDNMWAHQIGFHRIKKEKYNKELWCVVAIGSCQVVQSDTKMNHSQLCESMHHFLSSC